MTRKVKKDQRPQDQPHRVLRRIRYKKPGKDYRTIIEPGEGPVDFPHLDDAEYQMLIRARIIAPVDESKDKGEAD